MSTVNLYDVLNINQDCNTKEIKDAYRGLVKEFHPDKTGGDAEMFELINHAYNILINQNSRKEYDEIYALSKQVETSHYDLKSKSKNYFDALDTDITKKKKSKDEQKIDFNKAFDDMDRKHGYKRDKDIEDKLLEKDTKYRLRDLKYARKQDKIENTPDRLFDDGRFDLAKFNAAFDAVHKGPTELIPHQGVPMAYNLGLGFNTNFGTVENYEDLYDDSETLGTSAYGTIKLDPSKKKKISKEEINKIASAEYTNNHNYKDKGYNKTLEEKLKERELFTQKLEDREMDEFDPDSNCGGYGIFDQIGLKNLNTIEWNDDEDIKTRYSKLLEMRKSDLK